MADGKEELKFKIEGIVAATLPDKRGNMEMLVKGTLNETPVLLSVGALQDLKKPGNITIERVYAVKDKVSPYAQTNGQTRFLTDPSQAMDTNRGAVSGTEVESKRIEKPAVLADVMDKKTIRNLDTWRPNIDKINSNPELLEALGGAVASSGLKETGNRKFLFTPGSKDIVLGSKKNSEKEPDLSPEALKKLPKQDEVDPSAGMDKVQVPTTGNGVNRVREK